MNNLKITIITLFAFLAIATACCKKPVPATIIGTNRVTCTINGQRLESKGGKPNDNPFLGCQTGNFISSSALGGVNYRFDFNFCLNDSQENLDIYIHDSLQVKKYSLGSNPNKVKMTGLFFTGITDNNHGGTFEITQIEDHAIIGKFSLDLAIVGSPSTAHITNGTFNLAK
jgi:hypothetical protein